MEHTEHYGLKKPGAEDFYKVSDFNENAEAIDAALHGLETGKAALGADGKVPAEQLPEMDYEGPLRGAPAKETPADADGVILVDAGDQRTKKLLWSRVKAVLKGWMDTLYAAASHTHAWSAITGKPTSMTPTAHKDTHKTGGADALTAADVGAAAKSTQVSTTIGTAWGGSAGAWTQTLSIAGVTATNVVEVFLSKEATDAQDEAFTALQLRDGGQAAGSITLRAFGSKNTIFIPITVIVRGDL